MYKVVFYTPPNKTSPIDKFLLSINTTQEAKIVRSFIYLKQYGLSRVIPNLRKLTGTPLWELRILGRDNIRIICFLRRPKDIVILHIFFKKKRKTPIKELGTATKRYKNLIDK